MHFNIIDPDTRAVLESHDTHLETIDDYLLGHYPPEFGFVGALLPMFDAFVPGATHVVVLPPFLTKSAVGPFPWTLGLVVPEKAPS